jgi:hypothetical protein
MSVVGVPSIWDATQKQINTTRNANPAPRNGEGNNLNSIAGIENTTLFLKG